MAFTMWGAGRCTIIAAGLLLAGAATAQRLPALEAQADRITVSGLSSGAYMAVQFAVAHSARVAGVRVFAGGPYYCVGINPARAECVCMQGNPGADASILDAEAAKKAPKKGAAAKKTAAKKSAPAKKTAAKKTSARPGRGR